MSGTEGMQINAEGSPYLFLGVAATEFQAGYKGRVDRVSSMEELRDTLSYYTGMDKIDHPLVISDLSYVGNLATTEAMLLKFAEETKVVLVLLASVDMVSSVLVSRMKTVFKVKGESVRSEFGPPSSALDGLKEIDRNEGAHLFDKLDLIAKKSPKYLFLMNSIKSDKLREKILGARSR